MNTSTPPLLFDERAYLQHIARAAKHFELHSFLYESMTHGLVERLEDINRDFSTTLLLGRQEQSLLNILQCSKKIKQITQGTILQEPTTDYSPDSMNAILHLGALNWVNNIPLLLQEIKRTLIPDGLFLGVFLGGETLFELRESFLHAAIALDLPVSPYISPMISLRDGAALLQHAGFALPVAESEIITASYANIWALMHELRGMGETNALLARNKKPLSRTLITLAQEYYQSHFPEEDGRIKASFECIYITGWKPHSSQQQPAPRGSGKISLTRAFK